MEDPVYSPHSLPNTQVKENFVLVENCLSYHLSNIPHFYPFSIRNLEKAYNNKKNILGQHTLV